MDIIVFLTLSGMAVAASLPAPRAPDVMLQDLPDLQQCQDYRVDPYIKAAAVLQEMGKGKACKRLNELAREEQKKGSGDRVIVLCRMLFSAKPGGTFRGPMIGAAFFLGGTDYGDWPREPIEIVDGVPFLITQGYALGGRAEPPSNYLAYCLDQCDWGGAKYVPKTTDETAKALKKLVSSRKWTKPLDAKEKDFLSGQIR